MSQIPEYVRELMTTDVVTVGRNDTLRVADDVMRLGRIRHLPVLDEQGDVVGIVSQRDLFHNALLKALGYGTHAQQNALASFVVKEAMTTAVITATPEMRLVDAAERMLSLKVGCLVVLKGTRIAGILTEADFVKLAVRILPALPSIAAQ